jgi:hypothetical protein
MDGCLAELSSSTVVALWLLPENFIGRGTFLGTTFTQVRALS